MYSSNLVQTKMCPWAHVSINKCTRMYTKPCVHYIKQTSSLHAKTLKNIYKYMCMTQIVYFVGTDNKNKYIF